MKDAELTGQSRAHIATVADPACQLHAQAVAPFLNMRKAALADGVDLLPLSSFRDFDRQLAIWNAKFSGRRPMLDAAGKPLDAAALAPRERIEAILLWSALPGASRHHWGTDLDLIDGNADAQGFKDKLSPEAFAAAGPFARLNRWLDAHAARFGFFRPYQGVRSGVRPEPWHFSFAPVAEKARRSLSKQVLRGAVAAAPLLGKEIVLEHLDALHARYVESIDLP
ncbi:MAG TPA: M15 family metallopeptidase [Steroidobacteraceae bacterium]|nr:M15 family metallopeptidase [Steroidobacteraceae bacterium]